MNTLNVVAVQPSKAIDLLKSLLGKRVSELVRYSWWPAQDVASECGISSEFAFSLTAGPLSIVFEDGSIIGIASDPTINSVIVWNEVQPYTNYSRLPLSKDSELFPINADYLRYANSFWREFILSTLSGIYIIKKKAMNAMEQDRPSELGLRIEFSNGKSFIASHGLHDGSDDFSVLNENQLMSIEFEEQAIAVL